MLRRHARGLIGRAAPGRGAGHLKLAKGLRREARGRQDPDQLRPGRAPPLAGLNRDLPGEPRGQKHIRQGLQHRQLGLRRLLRQDEERVLPPQGLDGRRRGAVHGEARGLPRVLSGGADKEAPRVTQPDGVPKEACGVGMMNWTPS